MVPPGPTCLCQGVYEVCGDTWHHPWPEAPRDPARELAVGPSGALRGPAEDVLTVRAPQPGCPGVLAWASLSGACEHRIPGPESGFPVDFRLLRDLQGHAHGRALEFPPCHCVCALGVQGRFTVSSGPEAMPVGTEASPAAVVAPACQATLWGPAGSWGGRQGVRQPLHSEPPFHLGPCPAPPATFLLPCP